MKAEMPERPPKDTDGIGGDRGLASQTVTAWEGLVGEPATMCLEAVLRRENMLKAYQRVKSNGGKPGIDGMSVEELGCYLVHHWEAIREEIREGNYRPSAVRLVEIAKPKGGTRCLGIPTVLDRLIQQAVLQVLQPCLDPSFSDCSFGFRPGRSAHQALECARGHIRNGHRWVVDLDLENFFDRVNHDILMSLLARRISDKQVLRLMRRFLQAGLMEGGVERQRFEGTPQGSPLSPLLSNVLLHELDRELERRGHLFVRYADDVNIYVKSKRSGERVQQSLETYLAKRLRLVVNREKSTVDRPWKRIFLGYTFSHHRTPKLWIPRETVRRFKKKVRELTRRGRGWSLRRTTGALAPALRGWMGYFGRAEVKVTFEDLDQWIRRRLRCILWRQWKRPKTQAKKLMKRGLSRERAWASAMNGRGPWWNAGASHMNAAIPTRYLRTAGLVSLQEMRLKQQYSI